MGICRRIPGEAVELDFVTLLAYAAACRGGNFDKARAPEIDRLAGRLRAGEKLEDITRDLQYWNYYIKAYTAVLDRITGEYSIVVADSAAPGANASRRAGGFYATPPSPGALSSPTTRISAQPAISAIAGCIWATICWAPSAHHRRRGRGRRRGAGLEPYGGWRIGIRASTGSATTIMPTCAKPTPLTERWTSAAWSTPET